MRVCQFLHSYNLLGGCPVWLVALVCQSVWLISLHLHLKQVPFLTSANPVSPHVLPQPTSGQKHYGCTSRSSPCLSSSQPVCRACCTLQPIPRLSCSPQLFPRSPSYTFCSNRHPVVLQPMQPGYGIPPPAGYPPPPQPGYGIPSPAGYPPPPQQAFGYAPSPQPQPVYVHQAAPAEDSCTRCLKQCLYCALCCFVCELCCDVAF